MQEKPKSLQYSIINKESYQDFQCHICYQVALRPVQCLGSCHKKFCPKCVQDWKKQQDKCPLKCSQPFFVKKLQPLQISFNCPYNPNQCHIPIQSIQDFQEHIYICFYATNKQKQLVQLKKNNKCFNEHDLQFFLGTYEEMCESICVSCNQKKLCRLICRKCNQLYCVQCRPPLCTKQNCPLGHKFNYQEWNQNSYICDICGISTAITNKGVYDDSICNFGLCEQCHQNLPNEYTKQIKTKSPYTCNKSHQLMLKLPQLQKKCCINCQKFKICPKFCQICNQYYCLDCKIGIILEIKKCLLGHQLKLSYYNSEKKTCIKCQNQETEYFNDQVCQFCLCKDCIQYESRILDNKNRYVEPISCGKGHQLKFYSGQDQYLNQCVVCKKNKVIKLFCDYCPPTQRLYCCQCCPLKQSKMCYFGHQMQDQKTELQYHCQKCGQNNINEFKKCQKCNYFICNQCYEGK